MGALTEKGPKRQKGPQSVHKNGKLPKKHHNVSQKVPFVKISGPLGPSQEMKFLGPGGTGPPGFSSPDHGHLPTYLRSLASQVGRYTLHNTHKGRYSPTSVIIRMSRVDPELARPSWASKLGSSVCTRYCMVMSSKTAHVYQYSVHVQLVPSRLLAGLFSSGNHPSSSSPSLSVSLVT